MPVSPPVALRAYGPSVLDLRAVKRAIALLAEARKARKGEPSGFLIPNRLQKRGRLSREVLKAAEKLDVQTLSSINLRQHLADSAGQATVVWKMAKRSDATIEMENLLEEMTRDQA